MLNADLGHVMDELVLFGSDQTIVRQALSEDIFSRWVSYIDASAKTVETYSKAIKQFFVYLWNSGIKQPKRDDIVSYRDFLKKNHKPTTVQSYLAAVKLFFQWTSQNGCYPNVADRVKGAKLDSGHKKDYLTSKQVARFLGAIDRSTIRGMRDYAILLLMVTTGLRTISVVRADVGDVGTACDDVVLYYQGKGHEEKVDYVKLAEPVDEAIREYLDVRGNVSAAIPLFGSIAHRNNGNRMTTRSVSRIVKDRLIEAGLHSDRLTAHSLRHTAATLNLLNGATVEETQQLLGHQNINTTLIYSHALDRAKNNSESRIARAIFG